MNNPEREEIEKLRWLIEVQSLLSFIHFPPNNEEGRNELVKIAQNALTEAGY